MAGGSEFWVKARPTCLKGPQFWSLVEKEEVRIFRIFPKRARFQPQASKKVLSKAPSQDDSWAPQHISHLHPVRIIRFFCKDVIP